MRSAETVRAGIDGLVFTVIVIASIIAQIVKLGRRTGAKPAESGESAFPPPTPSDAEDEIQKFLRELSGGRPPPATQPPAPSPAPVPPVMVPHTPAQAPKKARLPEHGSRRHVSVSSRVVIPEFRAAGVVPETAMAALAAASRPAPSSAASAPATHGATDAVRRDLLAGIEDPQSLQKAWLLREVLGRPISLRPYSWPHT